MTRQGDPYRNFRFRVEIDGISQGGFSEVSGFDQSVDAIDYRVGTDPTHVRKLPGLTKFGNITLKYGMLDTLDLNGWLEQVKGGTIERKKIAIVVQDEAGKDGARFEIEEAWLIKYDAPDFNAKGTDVSVETLELACEGVKRVK